MGFCIELELHFPELQVDLGGDVSEDLSEAFHSFGQMLQLSSLLRLG